MKRVSLRLANGSRLVFAVPALPAEPLAVALRALIGTPLPRLEGDAAMDRRETLVLARVTGVEVEE